MGIYAYRIPPCPDYDIEGTEAWLEDMAKKGLILGDHGIMPGLVAFQKSEPQNIRYRLVASTHSYKWFSLWGYAPDPDNETKHFYEDFGWEYVATRRHFHIYAAKDPATAEMDTDPEIQAIAIKAVTKRLTVDMLLLAVCFALYIFLIGYTYYSYLLGGRFQISPIYNFLLWAILWSDWIYSFFVLRKLKKKLQSGEGLTHRSNYRKTRVRYWLIKIVKVLAVVAAFLMSYNIQSNINTSARERIDLNDYTGDIPFATMQELLPDAQLREDATWGNYITIWSSALTENYTLSQQLHITLPDGTETSGSLTVQYQETASESIAQSLADTDFRRGTRSNYNPTELTVAGVDYAFTYEYYSYDFVVLRKGSTFVSVNFHIYNGDPITAQEIADIMANSLE